jgi:hypothetical protein
VFIFLDRDVVPVVPVVFIAINYVLARNTESLCENESTVVNTHLDLISISAQSLAISSFKEELFALGSSILNDFGVETLECCFVFRRTRIRFSIIIVITIIAIIVAIISIIIAVVIIRDNSITFAPPYPTDGGAS